MNYSYSFIPKAIHIRIYQEGVISINDIIEQAQTDIAFDRYSPIKQIIVHFNPLHLNSTLDFDQCDDYKVQIKVEHQRVDNLKIINRNTLCEISLEGVQHNVTINTTTPICLISRESSVEATKFAITQVKDTVQHLIIIDVTLNDVYQQIDNMPQLKKLWVHVAHPDKHIKQFFSRCVDTSEFPNMKHITINNDILRIAPLINQCLQSTSVSDRFKIKKQLMKALM